MVKNKKSMKKILIIIVCLLSGNVIKAQTSIAQQQASLMAQKMKDTLNLTDSLKHQLFVINMQLHQQKQQVRLQVLDRDSLTRQIQLIEFSRDSMYKQLLPPAKYELYKQKKRFFF